jgi:hypothetical protein
MADTRGSSFLPIVKCSQCSSDIEISKMGDHICDIPEPRIPDLALTDPHDWVAENKMTTTPVDKLAVPGSGFSANRSPKIGGPSIDSNAASELMLQTSIFTMSRLFECQS